MSEIINADKAISVLREKMNIEMQAAAEPVIKAAVAEAEKRIRERVAQMLVSEIETAFSFTRHGTDLIIHVRGFGGKS